MGSPYGLFALTSRISGDRAAIAEVRLHAIVGRSRYRGVY